MSAEAMTAIEAVPAKAVSAKAVSPIEAVTASGLHELFPFLMSRQLG